LNKKGDNEWGVIYAVSLLPGIVLVIGYVRVLKITPEIFDGGYKYSLILLLVVLFILNSVIFLNKKRVYRIMNRYKNESETQRKLGNAAVIVTALLSLLFILFA
jgi:hypothetical protein